MPNYKKSIIYKLCCKDPNITEIYIGSTTNFTRRKCGHKNVCNNENNKRYNSKVYKFIRNNGNWDNWDMIQIEEYECENKRQLQTKERFYIETLKSSLNCCIPTRTKKEYKKDNKEKIKQYVNERYQNNKEKIKQYEKEYYEKNKKIVSEKRKIYREKNKDKLNQKAKEIYQKNKEKIKERYQNNKEKIKQYDKERYQKKKLEQANN